MVLVYTLIYVKIHYFFMAQALYPSQKRYRRENPTLSFQLKKEEKRELQRIAKQRKESVSKVIAEMVRNELQGECKELREQIEGLQKENRDLRAQKEQIEKDFAEYKAKEKERIEQTVVEILKEKLKK